MTIHLPIDVERDILAQVHTGRFASVDDALAEAWRSFRRQRTLTSPASGQGLTSALRDDAELPGQVSQAIMSDRQPDQSIRKPIWELIENENRSIPATVWDALPADLSAELDHYVYGTPKRPTE